MAIITMPVCAGSLWKVKYVKIKHFLDKKRRCGRKIVLTFMNILGYRIA